VNKGSAYDSWARGPGGEDRLEGRELRHADRRGAAVLRAAPTPTSPQHRDRLGGEEQPATRAVYLHSTGLVGAAAFRKDSEALRKTVENAVEWHEARRHHRKNAREWFGIKPAAGSAAVTVYPGYRRARHAGLRRDRAQAECS